MKNPLDPDWVWNWEAEEAQQPKETQKKPFVHRQMPTSRCPSCAMIIQRGARQVCSASGETISPTSGIASCAFVPRPALEVEDG